MKVNAAVPMALLAIGDLGRDDGWLSPPAEALRFVPDYDAIRSGVGRDARNRVLAPRTIKAPAEDARPRLAFCRETVQEKIEYRASDRRFNYPSFSGSCVTAFS
jgi:hypothetical protein